MTKWKISENALAIQENHVKNADDTESSDMKTEKRFARNANGVHKIVNISIPKECIGRILNKKAAPEPGRHSLCFDMSPGTGADMRA